MKHFILLLSLMPLFGFGNYWGKTGHRITGKIAEHHLTAKTKRALKDLLGGHSLAFATTFADEIKADRKNARFSPWHYV
ncbi:MAG: S1/P1 nuclease, partial [Bacteroidota bacterium]